MSNCIHEVFGKQAAKFPRRTAVVCGSESLTYATLHQRSNQLARYLRRLGVKRDGLVGIHVAKSIDLLVAILGVIKSGGAYVPLDPAYPKQRLQAMIDAAGIGFLITRDDCRREGVSTGQDVLLDLHNKKIAEVSDSEIKNVNEIDDLFYVIFTSGSTGNPKGVMVTHRNVARLFPAMSRFAFTEKDCWSFFHSYSFGFSVWEMWGALLHGGKLVVVPQETALSPAGFCRLIEAENVTIVSQTPSVFHQLIKERGFFTTRRPHLRYLFLSGEATHLEDVKTWVNHYDTFPLLVSTYAITETGGQVFYRCFSSKDMQGMRAEHVNTLGTLLEDTEVFVLDDQDDPVEPGEIGELYVTGPGIARGYLHQPELTEQVFLPNPFGGTYPLYRTGDRVRMLDDGVLEFIGRADRQLKIRGHRVELSDINHALSASPLVEKSAVADYENRRFGQRIVAYIVPQDNTLAQESDLELWPSLGEYNIYDDLLYNIMTEEVTANEHFRNLMMGNVKNKVVVDIGTGKDAVFARFCCEAGAKRIYAIELLEDASRKAEALVTQLGLHHQISVIHGNALDVQLPEMADVVVSRIVGNIGSSDGVVKILNDARRFLKPQGIILPQQCITKIAAVTLPQTTREHPKFSSLASGYVDAIFEQAGYPFDVRLCVRGFPPENIVSDVHTFEHLDFSKLVDASYERTATFQIKQDTHVDGFLLWLTIKGQEGQCVDYLENQNAWLPVFFPVCSKVSVSAGDTIEAQWRSRIGTNGLNPDYEISGVIKGAVETGFHFHSRHKEPLYRSNVFYQNLFDNHERAFSVEKIKTHLQELLPSYMLPTHYVTLKELPVSPNGKIDYAALPTPKQVRSSSDHEYEAPRTVLEQHLARLWEEVLDYEAIGIHDNFFALGGTSILSMELSHRLQEEWQDYIYVTAIFDAPTVADLANYLSNHYPETIARVFGAGIVQAYGVPEVNHAPVDEELVAAFRRSVVSLAPTKTGSPEKNPPAAFVLSPPRSGSTLLRIMLAGNPSLFVPPELALLSFNDLAERRNTYQGRDSFWLEGTVRSLMELHNCGAEHAEALMAQYEEQQLPTKDFYREMQSHLPNRLLIDKSTYYAIDPAILQRAEEYFDDTKYIHLLRHPYGMIQSYTQVKLKFFFRHPHAFSERQLAELLWLVSHRNIVEFLKDIPLSRQLMVKFEDLVADPEGTMQRLCEFVDVRYSPDMAEPYSRQQNRMTDGVREETIMLGDTKFHTHGQIDPRVATNWKNNLAEDFLSESSWRLAQQFGYQRQDIHSGVRDHQNTPENDDAHFLCIEDGGNGPPIVCLHAVTGGTIQYYTMARELAEHHPVYGFRAPKEDGNYVFYKTIEEQAEAYVNRLQQEVQSEAFIFCGHSGGGILGIEMAKQIQARGKQVPLVILVDTFYPFDPGFLVRMRVWVKFAGHKTKDLLRDDDALKRISNQVKRCINKGCQKQIFAIQPINHIQRKKEREALFPNQETIDFAKHQIEIERSYMRASNGYGGRILLLRTASNRGRRLLFNLQDYGWGRLLRNDQVTVVECDGLHLTLLAEPYASSVAKNIRATLAAESMKNT